MKIKFVVKACGILERFFFSSHFLQPNNAQLIVTLTCSEYFDLTPFCSIIIISSTTYMHTNFLPREEKHVDMVVVMMMMMMVNLSKNKHDDFTRIHMCFWLLNHASTRLVYLYQLFISHHHYTISIIESIRLERVWRF